ncbi:MAG TPA: DUF1501 domain-containing protein [Frankiaceae bacterium]|nr:DUF1501 domain-containing protein [Frankiaceae bacterium]
MALTRRQLIAGAGGAAAAHTLLPAVGRVGEAFGKAPVNPRAARRNRLVVLHLVGGNDGLNTFVPRSGKKADVYRKVRPTLAIPASKTLRMDRFGDAEHHLGLNPLLRSLYRLYLRGRVAVVQGVDYPGHVYSHFDAIDNWHAGTPGRGRGAGWIGRHLDRVGVRPGELRAVGIGNELPLLLRGERRSGSQVHSIAATRFADGTAGIADARHDALALFQNHAANEPLRRVAGRGGREAADLVDLFSRVRATKSTGVPLADRMLTARSLLSLDLGVETVYLSAGAYDTHTHQKADHILRLKDLDAAIEAFFFGTVRGAPTGQGALPGGLDSRTILMITTEFGRRVGENGSGAQAGTDHGAATPVILIGPSGRGATGTELVPGFHGDHPPMGSTRAPADNLAQTMDMRRVFQSVLDDWFNDPDPIYRPYGRVPGLFR